MDTNKTEKEILNQIMIWIKSKPEATQLEIKNKIIQEIKNRNYLKEDWQIHYAEKRIMNFVKKEIGINFNYAGLWLRLVAFIIDQIVITGVAFLVGLFLGIIAPNITLFILEDTYITKVISYIVAIGITWTYYASMESSRIQGTLGKMALKIKVIDIDGERISFSRATGRFFGKFISSVFFIGFFMIAFTEKKQGLHDKIADCLVIKK